MVYAGESVGLGISWPVQSQWCTLDCPSYPVPSKNYLAWCPDGWNFYNEHTLFYWSGKQRKKYARVNSLEISNKKCHRTLTDNHDDCHENTVESRFLKPTREIKISLKKRGRSCLNGWSFRYRGFKKSGFYWIIITQTMSVLPRRVNLIKYGWS